jgi:biofilm PGA synthesis N-glycosyltransferase PgaC
MAISVLAAIVSSAVAPMTDGAPSTLASAGTLSLISLFLLQFSVGVMMDHRYDRDAWRSVTLIPLYPAVFWILQFLTIIVAYPMLLARQAGRPATWISPDRGEP